MSPETFQIVILVGAYVVGVVVMIGAGVLSVLNYRSSQKVAARKDLVTRMSRLETETADLRDLVTRFGRRWNKRLRDDKDEAEKDASTDDEGPGDLPAPVRRLFG